MLTSPMEAHARCIKSEREALLKLKQDLKDPANRLASWNISDGNCCTWSGVVCDNFTGNVLELHLGNPFNHPFTYRTSKAEYVANKRSKFGGKINPSLLDLKHLNYLDLSGNCFEGTGIPTFLGSMRKLRYLNLSESGFMGMVPHQLGNLSNLQYLDINNIYYDGLELYVENFSWLSGLYLLQHLDLSGVNLSRTSDWLRVTNALPSLAVLRLSGCQLQHFPPLPATANFSSLDTLDVSGNQFGENSLIPSWVFGLNHVVYLDLSYNYFQGSIPEGLQNLTSLIHFDLSSNHFNSSLPNWFHKLSHLEYLSFGSNDNLQGSISDALENLTTSIKVLDFFMNEKMEGKIPRSLGKLCYLRSISLSDVQMSQDISEILNILSSCILDGLESLDMMNCKIFGHLTNQIGQLKNLDTFLLSDNSISGRIPSSLGELSSLKYFSLSNNTLSGYLSEIHFANLSKLLEFDISDNSLTLNVSPNWIPPFQVQELNLRSCHLGPRFPSWLLSQNFLRDLDISSSGIVDTIPGEFWDSSEISVLNFSNNRIHGEIPNSSKATLLVRLDLSSNNLSGPLPLLSSNEFQGIDLSNNAFSGSISHLLCHGIKESTELQILDLGDNFLSGEIPDCWINFQLLRVLNLGNNEFTGNLPPSMGTLSSLQSLHLQFNNLSGAIPKSLKNCARLQALNMGNNQFSGNISTWIGEKFSRMVILNLRSNKFGGLFPRELCLLSSLQVLDLAYNNFSGALPTCISNFSAMASMNYSFGSNIRYPTNFSISIERTLLVMKGNIAEYSSILNLVRFLDVSKNNFSGEIPVQVTELAALRSLNLSHNHFNGRIPESIDAMRLIEVIDLSSNQLFGKIPRGISRLTFLNHLNLSYNNLTGEIPLSTQLQSLDASSFIGNDLCGPPLPQNCTQNVSIPAEDQNGVENENEVEWFYVSMALGFVVGFWFVLGPLLVNRRWSSLPSLPSTLASAKEARTWVA
ncbi:Leucine-rich repeat receptor protein kinase [Melia azedarach]|uniref:Leucine-rich repeat receptor protein kinase n=1 Tax=Melia azedarach TaxID=155640 RepID=A0ACC1YSQ7_MELAZ|nr:Leucine-rich repeat receptor protein kinase [Melia azedarach]